MSLKIRKYHCSGNDILVVDAERKEADDFWGFLLHRKLGVGGDQCLHIQSIDLASTSLEVEIINQDGSRSERCLNGMLCLGLYLQENYPRETRWRVKTGEQSCLVFNKDRFFVRLDKIFLGLRLPQWPYATMRAWKHQGERLLWSGCDVGNPHVIIYVASCPHQMSEEAFLALCGRFLLELPVVGRVNVSLAYRTASLRCGEGVGTLRLRTLERGVGETLACGSASLAAAAVDRHFYPGLGILRVENRLGSYEIEVEGSQGEMAGLPQLVFEALLREQDLVQGRSLHQALSQPSGP